MVFSSLHFLLSFLPVFLLFYYLSPVKWKNAVALLGSLYFYAWGAPSFVFIIFTSLIIDYYMVRLAALSEGRQRKRLLAATILLDVGILAISKYLNFGIENLNLVAALFGSEGIRMARIALPIGISFITFQKISYVLDCYHGRTRPLDNLFDYALYILLFPQLIAGPIVRFNEVALQLAAENRRLSSSILLEGLLRFLIGLSKKVLLANALGEVADAAFALPPGELGMLSSWVVIVAYAFQIYFDFSGYSDMAIGLALMMGFRFPENFNFPYISQSITEFWRRWHITLSRWMRDYLYIPLGGNRVSTLRLYVNLSTVFLLSGLWHGAAWNFVIWGGYHGLFLILDRLFLRSWLQRIGKVPAMAVTFVIVLIGWVFFRSPNLAHSTAYLGQMFSLQGSEMAVFSSHRFWFTLALGALFSFMGVFPLIESRSTQWYENTGRMGQLAFKLACSLVLGWLCLAEVYASGFNPFIYFKF
ncbi:MAG: MBOAT family protein [Lewinellaceae bacterium]|nr:MBOAT family protein [Lewinellaceae bacterium]